MKRSDRDKASSGGFALENTAFTVAGRTLVHPLTLDLKPGRVTALLGRNGSGKSTLMKLLARQETATGGTIRFDGRPLAQWGEREFARRVAYLPQETPPANGLLVRELVAFGRYPWHGALGRFTEADRLKVSEAMELADVSAFADRDVDTLSGGERQRVWLAMLVAQDAGCLLLDEPISALDVAHQIEVLALIRRLGHERGLCIVVVLHDVNMAARFCDRIVALRAGSLVACESPARFMTPEALREVYGIGMAVLPQPGSAVGVAVPA